MHSKFWMKIFDIFYFNILLFSQNFSKKTLNNTFVQIFYQRNSANDILEMRVQY